MTLAEIVAAAERDAIVAALGAHAGNVTRAAAALGLERTHLHKKMRKHGLRGQGRPRESSWWPVPRVEGA